MFSGDFYTYADFNDDYWSGYFTSRPFYKKLDRVVESRLRAAEVIFTMANFFPSSVDNNGLALWKSTAVFLLDKLTVARRHLGLFQHHDGITGTSKVSHSLSRFKHIQSALKSYHYCEMMYCALVQDQVVQDYGSKLLQAVNNADEVIAQSAEYLMLSADTKEAPSQSLRDFKIDETRSSHDSLPLPQVVPVKALKGGKMFPLLFYNSLAVQRQELVHVVVDSPFVKVCPTYFLLSIFEKVVFFLQVVCSKGSEMASQVAIRWSTSAIDQLTMQPQEYELWFQINIPPMSLSRYYLVPAIGSTDSVAAKSNVFTMRAKSPIDASFADNLLKIEAVEPKDFEVCFNDVKYLSLHFTLIDSDLF